MRDPEYEGQIRTDELLRNAIEGIQNKIAKLRIAAFQETGITKDRISAAADSIQTNISILKEIKKGNEGNHTSTR